MFGSLINSRAAWSLGPGGRRDAADGIFPGDRPQPQRPSCAPAPSRGLLNKQMLWSSDLTLGKSCFWPCKCLSLSGPLFPQPACWVTLIPASPDMGEAGRYTVGAQYVGNPGGSEVTSVCTRARHSLRMGRVRALRPSGVPWTHPRSTGRSVGHSAPFWAPSFDLCQHRPHPCGVGGRGAGVGPSTSCPPRGRGRGQLRSGVCKTRPRGQVLRVQPR